MHRLRKLSKVLIRTLPENVDARQHVLDMCPDATSELVERSWSSDDLEIGFAYMHMHMGMSSNACMHACMHVRTRMCMWACMYAE